MLVLFIFLQRYITVASPPARSKAVAHDDR